MEKKWEGGLLTDEELKQKLASGEYSISPRSGRLRKKIRTKKKESFYSKRKLKKWTRKLLWLLLLAGFILTLVIVMPEINVNPKKAKDKNIRK